MNVKQGDIVICTVGRHAGKIGTVLHVWIPGQPIDGKNWLNAPPEQAPYWVVEATSMWFSANGGITKRGPFPDAWLHPVSGLPGEFDVVAEEPGNTGAAREASK